MINVIFTVHIFSRISKKRDLRKNMYSAKISTFTVGTAFKGAAHKAVIWSMIYNKQEL